MAEDDPALRSSLEVNNLKVEHQSESEMKEKLERFLDSERESNVGMTR